MFPIFYIGDFLWYKIAKMEKNTIILGIVFAVLTIALGIIYVL